MDDDLIRAEMHVLPENKNVLAVGNVTVANFLTIKNVRLMKGKDGNAFLSLPGEQGEKGWKNIVSVLTPEMKEKIKKEVLQAVRQDLGKGLGVYAEDISIKVIPVNNGGQLRGIATLDMFGLQIGGIKILEKKNQKGLYVSMPQYSAKGKNGIEWNDVVYPTSADARWRLSEWVLDAYEKEVKKTVQHDQKQEQEKTTVEQAEKQTEPEEKSVSEIETKTEAENKQSPNKSTSAEISDAVIKELEYEVLEKDQAEVSDDRTIDLFEVESNLKKLEAWIEKKWPLTDAGWDEVITKVSEYTAMANEQPDIIAKAVKMLDFYDHRSKEEAKLQRLEAWIEKNWPLTDPQWANTKYKMIRYINDHNNDIVVVKKYEELLLRLESEKRVVYVMPQSQNLPAKKNDAPVL